MKCCPVGQVDKGETAPRPPSAKENGPKPKDPGKLLKKLKELQDKVRKEKAVGSPDDIKYFDTKLLREVIFRYNNESQAYNPYPEPSLKALKDGAAQLLNELEGKDDGAKSEFNPLPESITHRDGHWLKKFITAMKSLAIGYWAEPNKLPPEYNHVRKEFLPVFQGEEVIHCMWKKQHCGYCNDTQLVFAPKRLKGVEDYMSTCYMHDPCGGGGKAALKGGKGSRAAKQAPKGSVSSVAANKQKSEDVNTAVDTADTPEFEPHDEQKVKMVEETMEREADQDIEK